MSAPADSFTGFPPEAIDFYAGLEAENTRDWWLAHKEQWERAVRDPMRALVGELEDEFGPAKLFRPNRDIRFSADKSPYKTHQGAFVGLHPGVGYYVEISATGLRAGGGFHAHDTGQTTRLRAAVDDEHTGPQLEQLLERLRDDGFEVLGERVRTTPRGYSADHPRIETLRHKELMVIRDHGTPQWLGTRDALDAVRASWHAVRPLNEWVVEHVGAA
jgi:uncharacterized protein (TIGR02453 family)